MNQQNQADNDGNQGDQGGDQGNQGGNQGNMPPPPPQQGQGLAGHPLADGDPIGDSLLTCGFTTNRAQCVLHSAHGEGLTTFEAFGNLEDDEIDRMETALARRTQAQGGHEMSRKQVMNLKAFVFWVQEKQTDGQPLGAAFTPADLDNAIGTKKAYERTIADKPEIPFPEKFPTGRQDYR